MDAGVFVLGMHRSGTSVATNLIHLLGLPTATEEDLVPPSSGNPKGHWESSSLVAFNRRILDAMGSETGCPVAFDLGWEQDPRLADLRREAPEAFRRAIPSAPWVWKDPRNCLTLRFWTSALAVEPVVILLTRNPLEIAASLEFGSGEEHVYALALWERYLRQTLGAIDGLPVLVTDYTELLFSPVAWCGEVGRFLTHAGVDARPSTDGAVDGIVERGLRHSEFTRDDFFEDSAVSDAQRSLFVALEELAGAHDRFAAPFLSAETPTTDALLNERRRAVELRHELRTLELTVRRSRVRDLARRVCRGARRFSYAALAPAAAALRHGAQK
jgi:hypothetical protein